MLKRKLFDQRHFSEDAFQMQIHPESGPPEKNVSASSKDVEGELHAALNPLDTSKIVVASISHTSSSTAGINVFHSEDFGDTWNKGVFDYSPGPGYKILGGGDPVLAYGKNGTVYITWLFLYSKPGVNNAFFIDVFWASSINNGASWSRLAAPLDRVATGIVSSAFIITSGIIFDKPWMTCSDLGDLHVSLTGINNKGEMSIVEFLKPATQNAFNKIPKVVRPATSKALLPTSIAASHNGDVVVAFGEYAGSLKGTTASLYISTRTSTGQFSSPFKITDIQLPDQKVLDAINLKRLNSNKQIVCDNNPGPNFGNLYLVWNGSGLKQETRSGVDVYISRSLDNGKSWSTPMIVNQNFGNQGSAQHHPSIYINSSGSVLMGWYDRRQSSINKSAEYFVGVSHDGGQSFTEKRASTRSTNFDVNVIGDFHIGEYVQVLATSNYIIPIWLDGRASNGNLDIYAGFLGISNPLGFERSSMVKSSLRVTYKTPLNINQHFNFNIKSDYKSELLYSVTDVHGKLLSIDKNILMPGENSYSIDLNHCSPGHYFLRLNTEKERIIRNFTVTN